MYQPSEPEESVIIESKHRGEHKAPPKHAKPEPAPQPQPAPEQK